MGMHHDGRSHAYPLARSRKAAQAHLGHRQAGGPAVYKIELHGDSYLRAEVGVLRDLIGAGKDRPCGGLRRYQYEDGKEGGERKCNETQAQVHSDVLSVMRSSMGIWLDSVVWGMSRKRARRTKKSPRGWPPEGTAAEEQSRSSVRCWARGINHLKGTDREALKERRDQDILCSPRSRDEIKIAGKCERDYQRQGDSQVKRGSRPN